MYLLICTKLLENAMSLSSDEKFGFFRRGLNRIQRLFRKNLVPTNVLSLFAVSRLANKKQRLHDFTPFYDQNCDPTKIFDTSSQYRDLQLISQSKHTESYIEDQFKPYDSIDSDTMQIFKDFSSFIDLISTVTDDIRFNSLRYACIHKDRVILIKRCSIVFYKTSVQCVHITKYFFTLIHDDGITYIGDIQLEGTHNFESKLNFMRIDFKRNFTGQDNFEIVKEIINSYNKGHYHLLDEGIWLGKCSLLDLHYPDWKEIGFPNNKDDMKLIQILHY